MNLSFRKERRSQKKTSESTAARIAEAGTGSTPLTTVAGWVKTMHDVLAIVLARHRRSIMPEGVGDRQRTILRQEDLGRWSACLSLGRS